VPRWLAAAAAAAALASAATWLALSRTGGGALIVTSRPAGARVELDGKLRGETTPTALRGVAAGRHRVRLLQDGHAPTEQYVELGADGSAAVDVALAPLARTVQVASDPPGALVYLDGRLQVGMTPLPLVVTADDFHDVRVEKNGFATGRRSIKPEDRDELISMKLLPDREPRGTLWVDSSHASQVFIDGGDSGMVTPTVGIRLDSGEHRIELRGSDGRVSAASTVKIAQGETVHLTLDERGAKP
jgi:hypothetical protein